MEFKDGQIITIDKFDKYKGRTDVEKPSWARIENSMPFDPEFDDFDAQEMWCFTFLILFSNRRQKKSFSLNFDYICKQAKVTRAKVESTLRKLIREQLVRVDKVDRTSTDADVTSTDSKCTLRDGTGRDGTRQDVESISPEEKLFNLWNSNCGSLPKAEKLTAKRKVAIKARLEDEPDFAKWEAVIKLIADSEFCCGKNNRGWVATFDFLLRPDTHVKASEGQYTNKSVNAPLMSNAEEISVVSKVIDSVSKFSAGHHMNGKQWDDHKEKIRAHVGDDAWKLITKFGGWQKIHQQASNPIGLRSQLKELAS